MRPLLLLISTLLLASVSQADKVGRHLTTSGHALIRVDADMATVHMQADALHRDGTTAKNDVDGRVNRLLLATASMGINEADIIASTLHLSPNYNYLNKKRVFSGYRASRTVQVTLRQLDQLNQLMDSALAAGVNNIQHIELRSSDDQLHRETALQAAINDSKQKAETLAAAYHARLGAIFSITYENRRVNYPRLQQDSARLAESLVSSGTAGRYIQDKIVYQDDIQVVFDLLLAD